jgi:hypothetical protein
MVPIARLEGHDAGSASFVELKSERFSRGARPMGTPDSHALELVWTIKITACKKLMSRSTGHFIGFRMISHDHA